MTTGLITSCVPTGTNEIIITYTEVNAALVLYTLFLLADTCADPEAMRAVLQKHANAIECFVACMLKLKEESSAQ